MRYRIKIPCPKGCASSNGKRKMVKTVATIVGAGLPRPEIIIQVQGCFKCGWRRSK